MRRKAEVFLLDVWRAADYICRRTGNIDLTEYVRNEDVRYAVERNFIIIGEAVSNLRHHYPEIGSKIEHLPAIVAFRNFVVHKYWLIDDEALWEIIIRSVPPLRDEVSRLLTEAGT